MGIETTPGGATVITGNGVTAYRFLSLKQMLKLEQKGFKTRGGAIRPRLAKEFGLKPRDSYENYIARAVELAEAAMAEPEGKGVDKHQQV
jgi:hypothetical protein